MRFVERQRNLRDAYLREQPRAHAVDLRQRQPRPDAARHHAPDPFAEGIRIDTFRHLIAEDAALRRKDLMQIGPIELLARDVGKDHAMPEGKHRLPLETAALDNQQRIALQRVHHVEHVVAYLLERVVQRQRPLRGQVLDMRAGCTDDVVLVPVLDLQHHDALIGMQHHEIGMPSERPHRDVVPRPGVVFEAILQAFGETQFAARIEAGGA